MEEEGWGLLWLEEEGVGGAAIVEAPSLGRPGLSRLGALRLAVIVRPLTVRPGAIAMLIASRALINPHTGF